MAEATTNRYALITGATSGIGYELAKLFAEDGYNLIIVARTQEDLQQKAQEFSQQYGVNIVPVAKDLIGENAAFELYDEVKAKNLTVDVLVNDAGQGQYGLFVESDIHRLLDIIHLNINSLTVLTHLFLKEMVARNEGKILQLASIASQLPGPYQAVYHATKAYVLSFTEALVSELKDSAVTVTALQPGATDTDFFNKAEMQESKILDSKLSDPVQVAKDGYEALMSGDDKVISGFKNKMMVGMSNLMPESTVANQMKKMQEPKDKNK
ncbi:SDR family NAD(P)-dependent oxidoreductase [Flavisolibacter ginsenosidimutans]|uniref:SDR family oxidoreductase n=1 Tax=Flavisolibacter ginsenosidimutans TaxID=661481 RepID=A0A5B8UKA4_9BACT|nr:SDR family oxidoreductase [Flavisolibacter ginsenosidimutans]QEC56445.1 SDR family oxidoreductase [Flavisolibacter ginsenosidimutans]